MIRRHCTRTSSCIMCPATPLEVYAEEICSAAKLISGFCSLEGYPQPSFDPQAPSVTLPPDTPLNVQQARQKIIDSSSRIQQLATEPSEYLPNLAVQVSFVPSQSHYIQSSCYAFSDVDFLLLKSPLHHRLPESNPSTNAFPASAGYATSKSWPVSPWKGPCATPTSLASPMFQSANFGVLHE